MKVRLKPDTTTTMMVRAPRLTLPTMVVALVSLCSGVAGAQTPLIDAVKAGSAAAVRTVLTKRPDVNATQPDGTTALHWAANGDAPEIVQMLVRAGASVKARNRCSRGA